MVGWEDWNYKDGQESGEAWSKPWGGSENQWKVQVLPRISSFIPTSTILEIAPGYGRWTKFLIQQCDHLIGVDINKYTVEDCKEKFKDHSAEFYVNDGSSLGMVIDNTIDFCFSFDSMVHVNEEVLRSYINQLRSKLKRDGIGFIHHSNQNSQGGRIESVGPRLVKELVEQSGMRCLTQESIPWHGGFKDCITVFTKHGSSWPNRYLYIESSSDNFLTGLYQK